MTPTAERELYLTDRSAWILYIAPQWVELLRKETPEGRRKLWRHASPELKQRIKEIQDERHSSSM